VDLGPALPIDDAVRQWREAIVALKPSAASATLRRLLWEPLARRFPAETGTVIIAPDGLLTAVPWGALAGGRPGTVLVEDYALATVPHAPFILDQLTAPPRTAGGRDTILAVGGMDDDLPGAARELETVVRLAGSRHVVRLQGATATTAGVLRELPQARWAHFDTHGFFADPSVRSVLGPDPDPLHRLKREGPAPISRNPLVLSGLVLAGANRASTNTGATGSGGTGILTAEAIAGLPLQDLELAMLSACDTGLGTVAGGEGVFGLQRAFHLAGTRAVIASLWKVEIHATQTLMAEFYKNLWEKKLTKLEALRQAQLALLRNSRPLANAGPVDTQKQPGTTREEDRLPPFFWAAFVLSGDWR